MEGFTMTNRHYDSCTDAKGIGASSLVNEVCTLLAISSMNT
jgi:hypothetical protein